jgi:hypothetical protein
MLLMRRGGGVPKLACARIGLIDCPRLPWCRAGRALALPVEPSNFTRRRISGEAKT